MPPRVVESFRAFLIQSGVGLEATTTRMHVTLLDIFLEKIKQDWVNNSPKKW
jgi:hypothetical protein